MRTREILIVDDDATCLHLLSTLFEANGFDVAVASDGVKAMEILKKNRFRMIITDFNMPQMNGIELAIRAREQHSDTHVVMVTGKEVLDVFDEAVTAGISRIFTKPVDSKRLVASVRSSLSRGEFQAPGL